MYGLSNAQIAEQFKITEEQLSEKIERWTHQEEEEIRKYEENYITDEERIARNKAIK